MKSNGGGDKVTRRMRELASTFDTEDFRALYHDPALSVTEIAQELGIAYSQVSILARHLGVPNRREAKIRQLDRKPKSPKPEVPPGHYGCNETCPVWQRCRTERLWLGVLPCEEADELDNAEVDRDSFVVYRFPVEVYINNDNLRKAA